MSCLDAFLSYKFHSDARLTLCDDMLACTYLAMRNEIPGSVHDIAAPGQSPISTNDLAMDTNSLHVYDHVSKGVA